MTEPRGTPQQTSTDKHNDLTNIFVGVCCNYTELVYMQLVKSEVHCKNGCRN